MSCSWIYLYDGYLNLLVFLHVWKDLNWGKTSLVIDNLLKWGQISRLGNKQLDIGYFVHYSLDKLDNTHFSLKEGAGKAKVSTGKTKLT